jgi:hypothetical protein
MSIIAFSSKRTAKIGIEGQKPMCSLIICNGAKFDLILVAKWNRFKKMATITLKNIPNTLYERLKYFAKLRHRSLNSEIIFNLEKSVGLAEEDPEKLRQQAKAFRERLVKKGQLTPEDIEKAINEGRP